MLQVIKFLFFYKLVEIGVKGECIQVGFDGCVGRPVLGLGEENQLAL
jgi:hypothetical protein